MKAQKLILFAVLISLTSCLPDSFTKFREDAPVTSPGQGGTAGGGGPAPTPPPPPGTEVTSFTYPHIQTVIGSFNSNRFTITLTPAIAASNLTVGDDLFVAQNSNAGTGGSGVRFQVDAIDSETGVILISQQAAPLGTSILISPNDLIDNCPTGFGTCIGSGTSIVAQVTTSSRYFDLSPIVGTPTNADNTISLFPLLNGLNPGDPSFPDDISFSIQFGENGTPGDLPFGIGFNTETGQILIPEFFFIPRPELNQQDFVVTAINADGITDAQVVTTISNTPLAGTFNFTVDSSSDFDIDDNGTSSRVIIDVAEASGFSSGDNVFICSSVDFTECSQLVSSNRTGTASLYFTDSSRRRLFAIITQNNSQIDREFYVLRSDGLVSSQITRVPTRLFRPSDSFDINITAEGTPGSYDGSASVAVTPPLPPGLTPFFTVTNDTVNITIRKNNPASLIPVGSTEHRVTITSTNPAIGDNVVLATNQDINIIVQERPTSLSYTNAEDNGSSNFKLSIDQIITPLVPTVTGLPIPGPGEEAESDLFYTITGATLPTGLVLNSQSGEISGIPTSFSPLAPHSVQVLHPVTADNATDFFATASLNIATATSFSQLFVQQRSGDQIIIETSESAASSFSPLDRISNPNGGIGTINFIDGNFLFVTVDSTLQGPNTFRAGQPIDDVILFSDSLGTIERVIHTFDVSTNLLANPIETNLFNGDQPVTLAPGETTSYTFSPELPSDLTSDTVNGRILGLSASGQAILPETTFTIRSTNSIADTAEASYTLSIIEDPIDLSVAALQVIHFEVPPSASRFFVGQRISTSGPNGNTDPSATGTAKIIDIHTTAGNIESMIVSASRRLLPGEGVDNQPIYIASEGILANRQFAYVTSLGSFTPGETISTVNGDTGEVVAIDSNSNRITFDVAPNSTFSPGDAIDNSTSFSSPEGFITSITDQNFADAVLVLTDSSAFPPGSYITSSTGAIGTVVVNDADRERVYVRVHATAGGVTTNFAQGNGVDNIQTFTSAETTIQAIISPSLRLSVGSTANFSAGENLTANSGGITQATGTVLSVDGTTGLFVQHEQGLFQNTDDLDDANPFVAPASSITGVSGEKAFYLNVGDSLSIQTYLRGNASLFSLSPELPDGLNFDPTTGTISGTPTETSGKTLYTLIARNGTQTTSQQFSLQVISHFFLFTGTTTDSTSYVLHKSGEDRNTTDCRVSSLQTDPGSGNIVDGVSDINCLLEAGELDLNESGIMFRLRASGGMCDHIAYDSYRFNSYLPVSSDGIYYDYSSTGTFASCANIIDTTAVNNVLPGALGAISAAGPSAGRLWDNIYCSDGTSCTNNDIPDTPTCVGNYQDEGGTDVPNCDGGSNVTHRVICEFGNDPDTTTDTCSCRFEIGDPETCGGDPIACVDGALENGQSTPDLQRIITQSIGSPDLTVNIVSPSSRAGALGNTTVANFTALNSCIGPSNFTYDSNTWETYLPELAGAPSAYRFIDPLGGLNTNPFYTFRCLDSSFQDIARIRVYVRDWDNDFTPESDIDRFDNPLALMDDILNNQFNDIDNLSLSPGFASCATPNPAPSILTGTISTSVGQSVVTGAGTLFETELRVGQVIIIDTTPFIVARIQTNTILNLATRVQETRTALPLQAIRGYNYPIDSGAFSD